MRLTFAVANDADAAELADLRASAAVDLTVRFGEGHWSAQVSTRGVMFGMRHSQVWTARHNDSIVGTFRLATRKPWAIDRAYFSTSRRPLYLTDMAVRTDVQRLGIGRRCLEVAIKCARELSADTIRLDAYEAVAGAGPFYMKCGFREVGRVSYRGVPLIYYEMMLNERQIP
ncbi:MAG: GNAT family N-acetyltransferase [bacterium]